MEDADLNKTPDPSPWVPMSEPIDIKHIGKLIEELGECVSAAARALIQGIDSREPVTGKVNLEWLEDEFADVQANITLNLLHFGLDTKRIGARAQRKMEHLRKWHAMLVEEPKAAPAPLDKLHQIRLAALALQSFRAFHKMNPTRDAAYALARASDHLDIALSALAPDPQGQNHE